jgi:hypothetical protein
MCFEVIRSLIYHLIMYFYKALHVCYLLYSGMMSGYHMLLFFHDTLQDVKLDSVFLRLDTSKYEKIKWRQNINFILTTDDFLKAWHVWIWKDKIKTTCKFNSNHTLEQAYFSLSRHTVKFYFHKHIGMAYFVYHLGFTG